MIHVLRKRELENYLLDIDAIRAVLDKQATLPAASRLETRTADDNGRLLRKRADELKTQVVPEAPRAACRLATGRRP